MKKFFAIALALALTLTLAVTCLAAEKQTINAIDGTATEDVKVAYTPAEFSEIVYGVDVVFEDMTFTYAAAVQGTWNPETHDYDDAVEAKWTKNTATVTVTNHSNAAIVATVAYANADAEYDGDVEITVENATLNLDSAVDTAVGAAPSAAATVKASGTATAADAALDKIGTVTVSIAAAAQ